MAMEVLVCLLLLGSTAADIFQGDRWERHDSFYKKAEQFSDELEDFTHFVSIKKGSLAKHAAALHFVANEVDRVHQDVTKDQVLGSGAAVGGGLLNAASIALEVFKEASPLTYVAGEVLSLLGGYYQSTACSKEEEEDYKNRILANKIFDMCKQDLQEISDMYLINQAKMMFLEEEEGLDGTMFHKKLTEIKNRFPHILPAKNKRKDFNLKTQLSKSGLKVAIKSGLLTSAKEKFFESSKGVPKDASRPIKDGDFEDGTALSTKVSRTSKVIHVAEAATTAFYLYQNSKELYEGITHLSEGARSELAESMRDVATHIEGVIQTLDHVLS